jgi:serine protease Do
MNNTTVVVSPSIEGVTSVILNSSVRVQAPGAGRVLRMSLSRLFALLALLVLVVPLAPLARAAQTPDGFADLAERLLPTVVNISTTQTLKNADRGLDMPQFPPGSPFEDFFKNFMDKRGGNNPDAAPRKATALGSGFIIDANGLVVTNNHVIADADEITVILQDGQAYKATIVGRDTKADLALLKITTPNKLPAVAFGNSDESRVGDWVIAIGNPFGMAGTVTAGIISARGRDINAGPYDDFLQTDAAINKGNSGGPLLNMKGEVIGINTAILGPTGGSVGIGFAIPANLAKPVIADLQKFGKPRRGWLGVKIQSVTDDIAESLGLKDQRGALVADVSAGGPAAKAGIRKGDVITRFDGKDVTEMHRLPRIVAETPINKDVEVQLWRDGKAVTIHAVVGELADTDEADQSKENEKPVAKNEAGQVEVAALGLSVAQITPGLRERFEIGAEVKGVVVTDVKQSGPAAEKGFRPGDVIVEVSQEAVKTPAEFAGKIDAARKSGRKSVLLLVQSEAGVHFVTLKVETPAEKGHGQ